MRKRKPKLPSYTVSINELPLDDRIIAIMLRAYLSRQSGCSATYAGSILF